MGYLVDAPIFKNSVATSEKSVGVKSDSAVGT
jgi:hypothetical protein